jgi:hypothetical protein
MVDMQGLQLVVIFLITISTPLSSSLVFQTLDRMLATKVHKSIESFELHFSHSMDIPELILKNWRTDSVCRTPKPSSISSISSLILSQRGA